MTENVRYRNMDRIRQDEQELEELENQYRLENDPEYKAKQEEEKAKVENPPATNPEEETWKKRHGDLRRYTQGQINEKEKEILELRKALADKDKTSSLPQNKEEAEKWAKDYPDLARVLMTLMEEKADLVREDVRSVRYELEQERLTLAREQAIGKLIKAHPDFFELRETDEFKSWVEAQPEQRGKIGQALYDALYNNETDGDAAIHAINIFKSDTKSTRRPKDDRTHERNAAESVRRTTSTTPPDKDGKRTFLESEIDKMNIHDYSRLEAEIDAAKLDGRIIYDQTGAAR